MRGPQNVRFILNLVTCILQGYEDRSPFRVGSW